MSNFTVRELVIRVSLMRPKLDVGLAERLTQEAAKRVFRESFLGQVVTTVYPIPKNCNEIMLTSQIPYWNSGTNLPNYVQPADLNKLVLPTSWDGSTPDFLSGVDPVAKQKTSAEVLRVLQVRTVTLPLFSVGAFQGWLFPSSVVPAANTVVNGGFYIVYQGTVTVGTLICKGGDILQSNGSVWSVTPIENYDTLVQTNWQTQQLQNNRPKSNWNSSLNNGSTYTNVTQANQWSQRSGQMQTSVVNPITPTFPTYTGTIIDLYPTQGYQTVLEVTYAATPIGDIADVVLNLPDEARDAIVNLALADWLAVPGEDQNLILSENRRMEYERLKSGLRAMGALGIGGSPEFKTPLFGGRGNRYFPFFYNPTLMPGPN